MKLITDTREQNPLSFVETDGVEHIKMALPVGDYMAEGIDISIERKSLQDLFISFSTGYEAERNKIIKAKARNLTYIIAIEGSILDVRVGHEYWKDGEMKRSKKDGLSMVRQLMTIQHKYGVQVWFCGGRKEMAFQIQEYFLAKERATVSP